ncbi:biopolymer transporter ExbD [Tardibacter chloracetimidivorans]|uniref:Biopolymer transporter ExbD n=1 Tax=Tardibacter chloracetimidivorans TaxID=1921510 RepID=A0A1L3ZRW4_9SPHN|nr:biopolymer transporter ExbD [Tardibacter chloracetimidivorans]API58340.1 biopolymer transporter ExbD [Tardibacter chloracetimidivorans]
MAMSVGGGGDDEPMMDINTTPLIDVMLVLLIMFIITIPVQTHAVKLDLPQSTPQDNPPPIDPIKNVVRIDQANTIYWNGTAVDPATLKSYLRQTTQMDPEPELHLEPDPNARYALVDQVLAVAKQSQVTKMGFVGNERYYAD